MTPNYVAVREHWTIQEALDYIRTHGQNSETLNVIYIVDQQGLLIDDLGIRDILLASPEGHISDLMDRRFVALKATDDGQTAVAEFRQHDRTALPVTDTAGMLIGIVTIDDVLDIAEGHGHGGNPADRRIGSTGRAVHEDCPHEHGEEARGLARHSFHRRDIYRDGDGIL
jgi:CBS domain-containing protein